MGASQGAPHTLAGRWETGAVSLTTSNAAVVGVVVLKKKT